MYELGDIDVGKDQTTETVLLRIADKAVADKDWEKLVQSLDAYRVAMFGNQPAPSSLTDRINSCRSFIAARNYEKTGDVERAVLNYNGRPSMLRP